MANLNRKCNENENNNLKRGKIKTSKGLSLKQLIKIMSIRNRNVKLELWCKKHTLSRWCAWYINRNNLYVLRFKDSIEKETFTIPDTLKFNENWVYRSFSQLNCLALPILGGLVN